jgi:ATP/ADP translocase
MVRLVIFARTIFPNEEPEYVRNVRISHIITLLPIFYFIFLVLASWLIAIYHYLTRTR